MLAIMVIGTTTVSLASEERISQSVLVDQELFLEFTKENAKNGTRVTIVMKNLYRFLELDMLKVVISYHHQIILDDI